MNLGPRPLHAPFLCLLILVSGVLGAPLVPAAAAEEGQDSLWRLPEIASTYGESVDSIFLLIAAVTGIAFLIVMVSLLYFCIRYRARKGHKAEYTHGNSKQALLVSAVLSILVFVSIDMNAVRASNDIAEKVRHGFPKTGEGITIRVLAQQFAWNVHYAGKDGKFGKTAAEFYAADNLLGLDEDDDSGYDDLALVSIMAVPVNTPIVLELTSKDVIHSFFLPNMRVKQDVVPGMKTRLWFEATRIGKYEIVCAELCGMGHYKMRGTLEVMSKDDYEKWLKDMSP